MSRRKSAAAKGKAESKKKDTAASSGKVASLIKSPANAGKTKLLSSPTNKAASDSALTTPPWKSQASRDLPDSSPAVPVVSVGTAIASKSPNLSAAVAPDKCGLSDQRHVMNGKDLANVLSLIVADEFAYGNDKRKIFHQQFKDYLPKLGAESERSFSMLQEEGCWFHNSIHVSYSCVNMSVVKLLTEVASYTRTVLRRGKHLTLSVCYKSLERFVLEGTGHPGINDAHGSDLSIAHVSQAHLDKLPSFKVPKFGGDLLAGDVFLKKIRDTFKSAGQAQYLEDEDFCNERMAWSEAFVSRLCESVADSATLSFLSTQLEEESNCAVVFQRISDHLSSSDLATARIFEQWMQFFRLKCQTRDEFSEFFSSAKGILHKLKTADSVAVTDDTFIRAYLAKIIEAPELQQEVKQFIISSEGDYESILDKVFTDFRAQESSEHLRSATGTAKSVSFVAARRVATKATKPATSETGDSGDLNPPKLSSNYGNIIPSNIYTQLVEWFPRAARRNDQDKAWLKKMKWKHYDPTKSNKYQRNKEYRDRTRDRDRSRERERERDYCSSRRARQDEYDYDTEDEYSAHQRRSRRSHGHYDRSRSRSPSPRKRRARSPDPIRPPPWSEQDKRSRDARRITHTLFKK